jgi:hypothetical protein
MHSAPSDRIPLGVKVRVSVRFSALFVCGIPFAVLLAW